MTIKTTITYNSPAEFTFAPLEVAVTDKARLLRQFPEATYTEDFSSDAGMTYDNTKARFTPQDDVLLVADYEIDDNATLSLGDSNGNLVGDAVVSGGALQLIGASNSFLEYDGVLNAPQGNVGAIRFKVTPNYTGSPAATSNLVSISKEENSSYSEISVYHATNGVFYAVIRDLSGTSVGNVFFPWSPVSGQTYEIEVNFDFITGEYRVFVDGLVKLTITGGFTGDRGETTLFRLGKSFSSNPVATSNASIEEIVMFNAVQHTSNYTPVPFVLPEVNVEQVALLPASAAFGNNFDTLDKNWDNKGFPLTVILQNSPTLLPNQVECVGLETVSYESITTAENTYKFIYTPNYFGAPVANLTLLETAGADSKDLFRIEHRGTGIFMWLFNSGGGILITATIGNFNPLAGTPYEFEVSLDSVAGIVRLFIDGVEQNGHTRSPWPRGLVLLNVSLGASVSSGLGADGKFEKLLVFDSVQHIADYTPGYTIPDNNYGETVIELPSQVHPQGIGMIDTFSAVDTGLSKYIINGNYWDGAAWVISDNTYAQSSTNADVVANIATYDASFDPSLDIKVVFPTSSTQSTIESLDINYKYNGDFTPLSTIIPNTIVNMSELILLDVDSTIPLTDDIKYTVLVNGLELWNDPLDSAWKESNGTILETNYVAEINDNASTLNIGLGAEIQIKAYLVSGDVNSTPELATLTLEYIWGVASGCETETCVVFGCILDNSGLPISGAKITVDGDDFFYTDVNGTVGADKMALISRSASTFSNSEGEWNISIVETVTDSTTVDFLIEYTQNGKKIKQTYKGLTIPNQVSVPLGNLVNP